MKTTIDSVSKFCCPSYHDQAHVIPVFFHRCGRVSKEVPYRREKDRHDGTSKDVVNSKKSRHVHKQRKTMERQNLANFHRQRWWINIDLGIVLFFSAGQYK